MDDLSNVPMQPQEVPQPQEAPTPPGAPQLQYVPALKGIQVYFAVGPGQGGGMPQLYSFDAVLGQWRIAQSAEMEQMMMSMGIPNKIITALKNFRM